MTDASELVRARFKEVSEGLAIASMPGTHPDEWVYVHRDDPADGSRALALLAKAPDTETLRNFLLHYPDVDEAVRRVVVVFLGNVAAFLREMEGETPP